MTDREVMKMVLDFIGRLKFADAEPEPDLVMKALRQALARGEQEKLCVVCGKPTMHMGNKCYGCCQTAQPEQDPVAWNGWVLREVFFDDGYPLSHREPPKQWVGLTDEEYDKCDAHETWRSMQNVAQMLKEKNT